MRESIGRLCASALAVALVGLAAPGASAALPVAARHQRPPIKVKVDPRLFGVHDAYLNSLSRPGTGSIRLWDTGTSWEQMAPSSSLMGDSSYTKLDQVVAEAWANHTEVTFVAAMTPSWALAAPTPPTAIQPANTYPPTVSAYSGFLRQVMARYKNYRGSGRPGIANYQVWNEANISTFWNGTTSQMAQLVKAAYDVRNTTDPGVRLVAPAMVTRLAYQQKWIKAFYQEQVAGVPVWRYVDAISFNLYPPDVVTTSSGAVRTSTPEDAITLLGTVRGILAGDHVPSSIPIWNTEINYGMGRGTGAARISDARQIANVMRTYLLNAAQGVQRVDWYAYDMGLLSTGGTLGNTLLTDPSDRPAGRLTPAGLAFTRVQRWMRGTMIGTVRKRPCIPDLKGTYTCLITYAHGVGRVYWNPYRSARVLLVKSARKKVDEYGATTNAKGGTRLKVNYRPVLVKSRR